MFFRKHYFGQILITNGYTKCLSRTCNRLLGFASTHILAINYQPLKWALVFGTREIFLIMDKKILIMLTCLLVSTNVFAKYITQLSNQGVEITKFFTHKNGAVSLYISGTVENLDKCTSTIRVYIPTIFQEKM